MCASLTVSALVACADASGSVTGGAPRFDAAPPEGPAGDGGVDGSGPEDLLDAGSGTRFSDLYRDLFGPTGAASCAGSAGACHGETDGSGARGSGGFVCADQDGCRNAMLGAGTGMVTTSDFSAPADSLLVTTLRRRSSSGTLVGAMPKSPPYVFSHASIDRIETWIRNGAPND